MLHQIQPGPAMTPTPSGNLLFQLFDFILHVDQHLQQLAAHYGLWVYGIVFLIIFCETGLVVLPLLPGDSLLFAAGSLAAAPGTALNPHLLFLLIAAAAVLGDNLNYWVGRRIGAAVFQREDSRVFKRKYLDRTRHFYDQYGVKTIILARFVPIVRTFAPFVAGVGAMRYRRFLAWDLLGGVFWVGLFVYAGYFFGQLPLVQRNFKLVIAAIILVSLLPPVVEVLRQRRARS
jgi:membrane-associated protein